MPTIKHALRTLVWAAALLLAGCHASPPPEPSDQDVTRAEALRPADTQLAAKYERACQACHGLRSAAPLTGFEPAWAPRVAKGADVLLQHARDGFNGMPAKGLCSDCTDDDLRDLIAFMSKATP